VKETSQITKVDFTTQHQHVSLTREGNHYMYNRLFVIKKNLENTLLNSLALIEIQSKVTADSIEKAIALLQSDDAAEVTIYKNDNIISHFYIVSDTLRQITYIAKQVSKPYILKIAGFNGNISRLYNPSPLFWRSLQAIAYQPQQIQRIELKTISDPKNSFTVYKTNGNKFGIKDAHDKPIDRPNTETLKNFVLAFADLPVKQYLLDNPAIGSILKTQPQLTLTITTTLNMSENIEIYNKTMPNGNPDLYNTYVYFRNTGIMAIAAYKNWDAILKDINYFK
jgi:hypothetical protein